MLDLAYLSMWAATLALMPYAAYKKKHDLLATLVVSFLMLTIPVMMMLTRPNPDNIRLVPVVVP